MSKKDQWIPMPRFLLRKDAISRLVKSIPLQNKKILEIGFGAGEMLNWFHRKGGLVTGVDFSESAREATNDRLKSEVLNDIELYVDFKHLNKKSFDVVCAFEVLEHIEDDKTAINYWLEYLKPGGSLIISVPAHMSKWCKNDDWAGHIRRYEKNQLKELVSVSTATVKTVWNYGYPFILLLDKLLDRNRKNSHTEELSTVEKTQKSGIDRPNKFIYKLLSNNLSLYPAFLLQRLFLNYDLGSGYLIHVKKSEQK